MPGIAIIANPNSRKNRANPKIIEGLRARIEGHGRLFSTSSLSELAEVAEAVKAMAPDVLCFNGGDGTNHCSLSAVLNVWGERPIPPLAFLKGGTMNTVTSGMGIKGSAQEILDLVVQRHAAGEALPTTELMTLKVDGDKYGFLFGTGMQARFLEIYYEGGDASPWKAVKVLSACVGSTLIRGEVYRRMSTPDRLHVDADGQRWPFDQWDMVGAGTVPNIAFFFRPYYRAGEDPQRFHTWGVACGAGVLSMKLPRIAMAQPPDHPRIVDQLASDLVFSGDDILWQIDGEIYRTRDRLTVACGPHVRVVTPGVEER